MTIYEKEFLNKYDSKHEFSEYEIEEALYGGLKWVDRIHGENRRWTRRIDQIVQAGDRFFKISYDQSLTKTRKNEYYTDIKEVEKHEKPITVNEWVEI